MFLSVDTAQGRLKLLTLLLMQCLVCGRRQRVPSAIWSALCHLVSEVLITCMHLKTLGSADVRLQAICHTVTSRHLKCEQ